MTDHQRHDHEDGSALSDTALRVRALETLLVDKGCVDPAALDALIDTYENKVGPRNGAAVVAKAWADAAYRQRLLNDATAAIVELDFVGRQSEHMVAVENTLEKHNMVVCTLCSCYPWPVPGAATHLVQVPALSFTRCHRPSRCFGGFRRKRSGKHRGSRLGFDG